MAYRGNNAKNTIETALQQHQRQTSEAEQAARLAARQVDSITRELGDTIERATSLISQLDVNGGGRMGDTIRKILSDRDRVRHETKDLLATARAELGEKRDATHKASTAHDLAEEAREQARNASSQALDEQPEWMRARELLETLDGQVDLLAQRHRLAVDDMRTKAPEYKDPLFAYLHERGYGEPGQETGNAFTRWMDSWVAGLIGYRKQVVNYRKLLALPGLLEKTAADAQAQRDELLARHLQAVEDAWKSWPNSTALDQAVAQARIALDACEREEARAIEKVDALEGHLSAFAEGDDPYSRKARETISSLLLRADKEADALVKSTASDEDDRALASIRRLQSDLARAQKDAAKALENHHQAQAKLDSVKRFRKKFQDARLGSSSRRFTKIDDSTLLAALVAAQALDNVFSDMKRHSRVDSASGSSSSSSSSWPSSSSGGGFGGGGFGGGGGGGFGGGGFGGGGSFGGGGFSTGGGF